MSGDAAREAEIAALVAAEKLREAAAACVAIGEHERAIALLLRAALPAEASELAEARGDFAGAARLAADSGERPRLERLAALLAPAVAASLARDLEGARRMVGAAVLYARAEDPLSAARCFAAVGDAVAAAEAAARGGDDRAAARTLAVRLEEHPGDSAAALALAKLCLRHGRWEAAAEALQRAGEHAPLGDEARAILKRALAELGIGPREQGEIAPATALEDRPVLFGRWEVLAEIAASPTARVLSAIDRFGGARVAVKLLRPAGGAEGRDAIARLEREARALALLRHPRVVPLVAWVPEGPALVLAWMPGGSLADVLAKGPVSPARAAEIARAVLEALAAAHRIGIVHRDVKPANVLFDAAASPYLADFGAAHVGDAAATVTAGLIGTLAYMAPEQREGKPAGVASDLYAVGAILSETLTGERAGAGAAPPSATHPELGAAHDALLARLLADDPRDRPPSAIDALAALAALAWPDVVPPPRSIRPPSGRPPPEVRFRELAPGRAFDDVLERAVVLVPLDDDVRALARAFAAADDDALACVLALDPLAERVVIAAPIGAPLGRSATASELETLTRALAALHRRGVAHGAVNAENVFVDPLGGVVLAFPGARRTDATAASDLADLARLGP